MNYMGLEIDPEKLISKQELLDRLGNNGANYRALAELRDEQADTFGQELVFRYPLSDGVSLGAYTFPVREGFLWIPFSETLDYEGELLELNLVSLLDGDSCEFLEHEMRGYADSVCEAFRDIRNALCCSANDQPQNDSSKTTVFIVTDFSTVDNLIELQPYAKRDDAVAHWLRLYEQAEKGGDIFEEVCPGIRFKAWFRSDRSNYHECEIFEEKLL